MKSITETKISANAPQCAPASCEPCAPHTGTGAFEELAAAMAAQGLFGKLRMGASLLLFGEVTLDKTGKPH